MISKVALVGFTSLAMVLLQFFNCATTVNMSAMEMEIAISSEPSNRNLYAVTINRSLAIQTTYVQEEYVYIGSRLTYFQVKEWVREIKKMYLKKNRQTIINGFSADQRINYGNGNHINPSRKAKDCPYELFQICVGSHCLIYDLSDFHYKYNKKRSISKAVRELLCDINSIVVGVGMESVAKKIEKDYGLVISKPTDLRILAEQSEGLELGSYGEYRMEKLAKVVPGAEWDVVKPGRIDWHDVGGQSVLSDDKMKYGTIEAFLAYEMGMKLLKNLV